MKKLFTLMAVVLFLAFSSNTFAQLAKDSWGFGFGFSYPRFIEHNTTPKEDNLGGFLAIQRNFTEHFSARFEGRFNHLSYNWYDPREREGNTNIISGNFDMLYYFVPCEAVSPYLTAGFGGIYYMHDNPPNATLDDELDWQFNFGLGIDWKIGENWSLTTEATHHTAPNSRLDGQFGTSGAGGFVGGPYDAYMTFNLGLMYTFSKGEPSKYCQLYDGISADVPEIDYERIENIVKKHIPKEVVKEVVVEKPMDQKWILVGVNFDFNKATLRSESYPVLFHAVQVLLQNPDMRVEIQGHTDNIGSDDYNMKLGERRAKTVKDYLVARGISADRLSVRSFGESQPIADNKTADGRAINRRVEFKVLN